MKKSFLLLAFLIISFSTFSQSNVLEEINQKYVSFSNGDILTSIDFSYKSSNFLKSKKPYQLNIIGVYYNDNPQEIIDFRKLKNPIKVSGVTYVKFNTENGLILKGNPVTSSSMPGVAMKATQPGMILGVALEDATNPNGLVKIRILIQYLK